MYLILKCNCEASFVAKVWTRILLKTNIHKLAQIATGSMRYWKWLTVNKDSSKWEKEALDIWMSPFCRKWDVKNIISIRIKIFSRQVHVRDIIGHHLKRMLTYSAFQSINHIWWFFLQQLIIKSIWYKYSSLIHSVYDS